MFTSRASARRQRDELDRLLTQLEQLNLDKARSIPRRLAAELSVVGVDVDAPAAAHAAVLQEQERLYSARTAEQATADARMRPGRLAERGEWLDWYQARRMSAQAARPDS